MAVKTFAAIDIGSYELGMKIFEISPKNGMKEIEHIRHRIDLGSDSFATGKISYEKVEELCRVLIEFTDIMKTYKVEDYKAYATSALRETSNKRILLDQIQVKTGMKIEILSNSEQRFMDYKSVAFKGKEFDHLLEKGTAIVDIGGGSIQISLFMKDTLVATQNLRLGVLRLLERMNHLNAKPSQYDGLIEEIVSAQLEVFKKLYLKERDIPNIIVVDDYLSRLLKRGQIEGTKEGYVDAEAYGHFMSAVQRKTALDICKAYDIPEEILPMLHITVVLVRQILLMMDAKLIWAPGVTLCDGIAYEYAEKNKLAVIDHDFEQDIIACAQNISKRYMGSKKRSETLEKIALTIFDSMKKVHGLGKRERLLLRIATMLHDCGKFISMMNLGECSYHIVMSTEIIGLSHTEREIVANVVKYNHADFDYPETVDYLTIAKLTAILRVANALDRSHKQKFKDIKTVLKDNRLVMTVASDADITLEKGLFKERADFFEEVFSVKPVIKQRKSL